MLPVCGTILAYFITMNLAWWKQKRVQRAGTIPGRWLGRIRWGSRNYIKSFQNKNSWGKTVECDESLKYIEYESHLKRWSEYSLRINTSHQ